MVCQQVAGKRLHFLDIRYALNALPCTESDIFHTWITEGGALVLSLASPDESVEDSLRN